MKKLSKRFLSLMLAMIMAMPVLLIEPFSAFASLAPSKKTNVHEYLTSSDNLGNVSIRDTSHVKWDSDKGGLWFDGNGNAWLNINDNPFSDVTAETGVTFSVDVYRDSGCPQWGRVFDFSNGDKNSNYFMFNMGSGNERFLIATKFDGKETRYWSDGGVSENGSTKDNTLYKKKIDGNYANFRNGIKDNTWYNIKISIFEVGGLGRMYVWYDNVHYYTFSFPFDYYELINRFKDYDTFYMGDSVFNDNNLKGCVRNLRIYNGVDEDIVKLGEWKFDNTFNDVNGQNPFTLKEHNTGRYGFYDNNHIYFSDNGNWGFANAPSAIREDKYKKNWRVDLEFNYVEEKVSAENTPVLGITNKSDVSTSYIGNESFGVARNGDVYLDGNNIGSIDFDMNSLYNNNEKYHMLLSYAYHNGIVDVLINHELKKSFDVRDNRDLFENIRSVTVGGNGKQVTAMDLWGLTFYSYQSKYYYRYENHLKARYFTSSSLTNNAVSSSYGLTTSGSGADWVNIDGKQAARFRGENTTGSARNNYLYLSKSNTRALFENADYNSGFTLSFEGKAIHDNSWQRFFDMTNAPSAYNGAGDSNKFLFFAPQKEDKAAGRGSIRAGYGTADQIGEKGNVSDITNWHVWTISVYQGGFVVYKDGVKEVSALGYQMNQDWFKELVSDNGMILFGASTYGGGGSGDPGFDGYMRDFRIYDIALDDEQVEAVYYDTTGETVNAVQISEFEALKTELNAAISAYETKMRDMNTTTYTNTKAAYDAYVIANRYLDSLTYGEPENMVKGKVKSAIENLKTETEKIAAFEAKKGTYVPVWYFDTNSNKKRTNFEYPHSDSNLTPIFSNILYASDVYNKAIALNNFHGIDCNVYYPTTLVWLYDGVNSLRVPVGTTVQKTNASGDGLGKSRQIRTLYPCVSTSDNANSSVVGLAYRWRGRGTNGDSVDYMYAFYKRSNSSEFQKEYTTNYDDNSGNLGYKELRCWANVLEYRGGGFTENSKEFSVPWYGRDDNPGKFKEDTNHKIYILNYKKITDNIGTAKAKVSTAGDSISNFKEGEASALINAYDAGTSFDPNSYFKSGNMVDNFNTCKTDLGNIVDGFSTSEPTNNTNYESLRTLMTDKKASFVNNGAALRGTYTTSSINNFLDKYQAAKDHMAALKDNAYNTSIASTLNTNLTNAYNALEEKADFTALLDAKASAIDDTSSVEIAAKYTTTSRSETATWLDSNTTVFPIANDEEIRNNTPASAQATVNAERDKFIAWETNANEAKKLDPLANLKYFDAEYDKANTFLLNLNGKAAEYTASSIQNVINAVQAAAVSGEGHANKSAPTIANANAEARLDFGKAVQTDANNFAADIKTAMDNLETIKDATVSGIDTSAYEEAVVKINTLDPDAYTIGESILTARRNVNAVMGEKEATSTKTYTADGKTSSIQVLNSAINIEGAESQADVDALITTTLEAINSSIRTYPVTKHSEGSQAFTISSKIGTYVNNQATYGTTIVATVDDKTDAAWYLEIKTGSMHKELAFAGYGVRFKTNVLGETTIKAVKRGDGEKRVKILRKYGDNEITDKSPLQLVEFTSGDYTLPAAFAMTGYTFYKYIYNGNEYDAGDILTGISEDIDVYACYKQKDGAGTYMVSAYDATGETVTMIDMLFNKAYNDKVEFTCEGAAGWLESIDGTNYRPFAKGSKVSFFVTEKISLKAVDAETFAQYSLPAVNLRKDGVQDNNGKKVFNAQIVNDGKEIQEYGILIGSKSNKTKVEGVAATEQQKKIPSSEELVIENSGQQDGWAVYRAKSTKFVGANQFTISFSSLPNEYIYRGYAIYKDAKGNLQTVYSEAMR